MRTNCILSAPILIPLHVYLCMPTVFVFLPKSCSRHWIPCWLLTNTCDICCDEFPVPQIDCKSKQVKEQWHGKFYLQSVWGKLTSFNTQIIEICGWITKVEATKNAICLHFLPYVLNICSKFELWISQGSVATCLRWGGYCRIGFVANFIRFPAVQKFWKSVNIWQLQTV